MALCGLWALTSCGVTPPAGSEVAEVKSAVFGMDGAVTVSMPNTVVNRYAALAQNAAAGATVLTVGNAAALNTAPGDLLLVIQMQGAEIDSTDTVAYGAVSNLRGAGQFEFVNVTAVNNNMNQITIASCSGGLKNAYATASRTQVVRVPQYSTLTVAAGGSIGATPWDGAMGGIVAVHAATSVTVAGSISASAAGFRGGVVEQDTSFTQTIYRSTMGTAGAEKGESVVGFQTQYDALGGRFGRGAPANGGGGGNAHNAGGGGGANAGDPAGWRQGQGVMDPNAVGTAAWTLDPGYLGNGNKLTTDAGGGRGGYTFSAADQDALTLGPSGAAWGGDNRLPHGGLGGHPLVQDPGNRAFFGGGGGAGDSNNSQGGAGGVGGGIVFVIAPAVAGTGTITANGGNGQNTAGAGNNDAPGGGGGGGSIIVAAATLANTLQLQANGGAGGNQLAIGAEAEGPGGGGGGGIIAVRAGAPMRTANGGGNGLSASTSLTEFPANGATRGAAGRSDLTLGNLLAASPATQCILGNADLSISIADNVSAAGVQPGGTVVYTVNVANTTGSPVMGASLTDTLPAGAMGAMWTCMGAGGAVCPAASGANGIAGTVNLPTGGSLIYTLTVPVPQTAMGLFTYRAAIAPPMTILDPNLANNTATDSDLVSAGSPTMSDLSVVVTHLPEPVTPGADVTYTVQVNNAGPVPTNVGLVTFSIPPGATIKTPATGMGWTCMAQGTLVSCTRPTIDLGMAPPISLVLTMPNNPSSGTLPATGTVGAANNTDPMLGNNTSVDSATVAAVDLVVSVSDNLAGANVRTGDQIVYTATVSNLGNIPATNVNLSETFAPMTVPSAWTCMAVGGAMCPRASGTGSINSNTASIPPGGSLIYQITAAVPAGAIGSFTNTVVALPSGNVRDLNPTNNTGVDIHVVDTAGAPTTANDLALQISHTPDRAGPGTDVTFTAQVTNNGSSPTGPTVVTFTLPVGSTVKTPPNGTGWMCQVAGLTVGCGRASADPGAAPPITVVITLPQTDEGAPTAMGTVVASNNTDPVPTNNVATDVVAGPQSDLAVAVTKSPTTSVPGEEVTYTITATNNGPDATPNPVVTFVIPPGGTVTMPAAGDGWNCMTQGSLVTCSRPDLTAGSAPPIVVKVQTATGTTSPVAVAQVSGPVNDPNPTNNRAVIDAGTPTGADLSLDISRDIDPAAPGQIVTYTAQVKNLGPGTAAAPSVTLVVPPGTQVVQDAKGAGWSCVQSLSTYTCYTGALAPGDAAPITLKVVTLAPPTGNQSSDQGAISGVVQAAANVDPNLANNVDSVDVGALPPTMVDLEAKLSRTPSTAEPGTTVTLQLDVTNKGTGTANEVVTYIAIPPGVEVIQPAKGDGWTCTATGDGYLCTRPSLAQGAAPPITLQVKAPTVNDADPLVTATVTAPRNTDANPADNTASIGVTGVLLKLAGGGFGCAVSMRPMAGSLGLPLVGALLGLLLLRRRRDQA